MFRTPFPCCLFALSLGFVALVSTGCGVASQGMNVEGVRLHQAGDYQAATQRFMQAVTNDPNNADGYYNLAATTHRMARQSRTQADFAQAENLYNQCLDRDPNHVECYRGLAVLLAESGRPDASLRLLEGWIARSPALADAKVELARFKEEQGDQIAAREHLLQAVSLDPNNSRALTALAHLRELSGETAQALANYQRSLAQNQFQPGVANRVATLHSSVGPRAALAGSDNTRVATGTPAWTRY